MIGPHRTDLVIEQLAPTDAYGTSVGEWIDTVGIDIDGAVPNDNAALCVRSV